MSDSVIGRTMSHYAIFEKIGEGGMGVVYRAIDTRVDRHVALKLLSSQFTASEEERYRFIREAKVVSSLNHPNICTVCETDQFPDGQMFIAMAYYEGNSLNKIIEKGESTYVALRGCVTIIAFPFDSVYSVVEIGSWGTGGTK